MESLSSSSRSIVQTSRDGRVWERNALYSFPGSQQYLQPRPRMQSENNSDGAFGKSPSLTTLDLVVVENGLAYNQRRRAGADLQQAGRGQAGGGATEGKNRSPGRPALAGGRVTSIPPVQVHVFSQEVEYLQRRVASQTQYLIVQHRDGRKESVPG